MLNFFVVTASLLRWCIKIYFFFFLGSDGCSSRFKSAMSFFQSCDWIPLKFLLLYFRFCFLLKILNGVDFNFVFWFLFDFRHFNDWYILIAINLMLSSFRIGLEVIKRRVLLFYCLNGDEESSDRFWKMGLHVFTLFHSAHSIIENSQMFFKLPLLNLSMGIKLEYSFRQ